MGKADGEEHRETGVRKPRYAAVLRKRGFRTCPATGEGLTSTFEGGEVGVAGAAAGVGWPLRRLWGWRRGCRESAGPANPVPGAVALFQIAHRVGDGKPQPDDAGHIFGAGPMALLLGAAVHKVGQHHPFADVQGSHPFGAMELVGREESISMFWGLTSIFTLPTACTRVGVEEDPLLPALGRRSQDG